MGEGHSCGQDQGWNATLGYCRVVLNNRTQPPWSRKEIGCCSEKKVQDFRRDAILHNKYYKVVFLKNINLFPWHFGDWKPKIKLLSWLSSSEPPLLELELCFLLQSSHSSSPARAGVSHMMLGHSQWLHRPIIAPISQHSPTVKYLVLVLHTCLLGRCYTALSRCPKVGEKSWGPVIGQKF